jgi:hypothetical protein
MRERNEDEAAVASVGREVRADDPRSYVLDRTRSEVHLLLDNLSASPEMTIFALTAANPPRTLGRDWLEQVCRISWPPDPSDAGTARQAEQAALLIKVKDYLNSLAKPASGATITTVSPPASRPVPARTARPRAARWPARPIRTCCPRRRASGDGCT